MTFLATRSISLARSALKATSTYRPPSVGRITISPAQAIDYALSIFAVYRLRDDGGYNGITYTVMAAFGWCNIDAARVRLSLI